MVGFEQYGGKRGYLEHVQSRLLYSLGAYQRALRIEWAAVHRLVFVCKGNICRSPYAAERSRSLGVNAISYGLEAKEGSAADPAAIRNAGRRNIDLTQHRSSVYDSRALLETDLVIVFEPQQLADARRRIGSRAVSVTLLGIWSKPICPYIHDPYGLNDDFFQRCYAAIDTYLLEVIRLLREAAAGQREAPCHRREDSEEHS